MPSNRFYDSSGWPPAVGRVIVDRNLLRSEFDNIEAGMILIEGELDNVSGVHTDIQNLQNEFLHLEYDYDAAGDGLTNDSSNIAAGIAAVKASGGILYAGSNTYVTDQQIVSAGTKAWSFIGEGSGQTILSHYDGNGTVFMGSAGSSVGLTFRGATIDCRYSDYTNAVSSSGFSIGNTSNIRIEDFIVRDFSDTGINIYSATPDVYSNAVVVDCIVDASNTTRPSPDATDAPIGMNIANYDHSGYVRCKAINGSQEGDGPGFGIQFKGGNDCFIIDSYAQGYQCGFGLAAISGEKPTSVMMRNCKSVGCLNGLSGSPVECDIDISIDMQSAGQSAIDLTGAVRNVIVARVKNLAAAKYAIRFETGCIDNVVYLYVDTWASGAMFARFDDGAQNNIVIVRRATGAPAAWTMGSVVSFATASDNNGFVVKGMEPVESVTISGGIATVKNAMATSVILDTEGGAATDDLDTITAANLPEGRKLLLRTAANARDVVLKHATGNLSLSGAADFTLAHSNASAVFSYRSASTKFAEVSRCNLTA